MSHGLELLLAFEEQGWSRGESTRLPLINVTRVQIPASTPYVGWVCCWFSPLLWEVFHRVLRFSPLLKKHWTLPTSNSTWNARTRLNELIKSASWVNKLQVTNLYHDIFEQERTFSLDWKHYCSSVWSNTTQSNLDKLQAVHNFACRIVSGAGKFDHITPLLKDLRWLPVKQQLYFRLAGLIFLSAWLGVLQRT